MFMFPYKKVEKCLDRAISDLVIFRQTVFSFTNDFSFCMPHDAYHTDNEFESFSYKRFLINKELFLKLKADCNRFYYKKWLATDHMGLVLQWFLQNSKSEISNSCEVICNDLFSCLTQFYKFMTNPLMYNSAAPND